MLINILNTKELSFLSTFILISIIGLEAKIDSENREIDIHNLQESISRIDTTYDFVWDDDSARWEKSSRILLHYQDENSLILRINQHWSDLYTDWENSERLYIKYNLKNQITQKILQQWDSEAGMWENQRLSRLIYDQGQNTDIYIYLWNRNDNKWLENIHVAVNYTIRGRKASLVTSVFAEKKGGWEKHEKINYYYSGNQNPHRSIILYWNDKQNSWEKNGRYITKYNSAGQIIDRTLAIWNIIDSKWRNNIKYIYNWEKDRKISEIKKVWSNIKSEWVSSMKTEYQYNPHMQVKIEENYKFDREHKKWNLIDRVMRSYKEADLNLKNKSNYNYNNIIPIMGEI